MLTLTFIAAWAAQRRPWHGAWLGLLTAAAFMLKGPGALALVAPFLVADAVEGLRRGQDRRTWARSRLSGMVLGAIPAGAWAHARWQYDQWRFFERMVEYDALARVGSAIEGHTESPFYYLDMLQRRQYEWLVVGVVAALLAPTALRRARHWLAEPPARSLVPAWLVASVVLPTLAATKLAWYLNPFYPLLAMAVAGATWHAWTTVAAERRRTLAGAFACLVAVAVVAGEAKLGWQSYRRLDLRRSAQGLLVEHADRLQGHRVFAVHCPYPEAFLAGTAGATCVPANVETFLRDGGSGDVWLGGREEHIPALTRLGSNRRASLHQKP